MLPSETLEDLSKVWNKNHQNYRKMTRSSIFFLNQLISVQVYRVRSFISDTFYKNGVFKVLSTGH